MFRSDGTQSFGIGTARLFFLGGGSGLEIDISPKEPLGSLYGSGSDWHCWGICLDVAFAVRATLVLLGFLVQRDSAAALALSLFPIVVFISFLTRS